jgi:hypothetical protein
LLCLCGPWTRVWLLESVLRGCSVFMARWWWVLGVPGVSFSVWCLWGFDGLVRAVWLIWMCVARVWLLSMVVVVKLWLGLGSDGEVFRGFEPHPQHSQLRN